MEELLGLPPTWAIYSTVIILFLAIWEGVWKLIALWKAAGRKQLAWFLCIGIINTAGILPIIYILMHRNKKED